MTNACNTIVDYPSYDGAMPLLYSIRDCVPFAFEGLLLVIFLMLFAGQYFLIKNRTGRAKILIALLSSAFPLIILSLFLALMRVVTYITVIFYAFICIVIFILFQLSDNS